MKLLPWTKLRKLPSPIKGSGAGLHANKALQQCFEEPQHLATPQLLPDYDLLGATIRTSCATAGLQNSIDVDLEPIVPRKSGSGQQ